MPFATSEYNSLSAAISANPALKQILWRKAVQLDTRGKNCLREMIGGEGSGKPVIEKTDLKKGRSETVVFITQAGIGGQGVLGENILKGNTAKHRWGSFQVRVDMLRQGVAYTDVVAKMTAMGTTIERASQELLSQWQAKKEEDDLQVALRRAAYMGNSAFFGNFQYNFPVINTTPGTGSPNLYLCGGATSVDTIKSAMTLQSTDIQNMKALIQANGGSPVKIDIDPASGAQIERYMYVAPHYNLVGLQSSATYMQALREGDIRGKDNKLFTGRYADWNGMVIYPHNVKIETSSGRLGSPWMPVAFLGADWSASTGGETSMPGGGNYLPAATGQEYDFFANFPGYPWQFTSFDTAVGEGGNLYAMIYNLTTDQKYEIVKYTKTGFSTYGEAITVTRGVGGGSDPITGNNTADTASRFSKAHPKGAIIIPCNILGVPLMWGAVVGEQALCYAKGMYDSEPIEDYEDHKLVKDGTPMIRSLGIASIRGLTPYVDTNGRMPNFMLSVGAAPAGYMGLNPVAAT